MSKLLLTSAEKRKSAKIGLLKKRLFFDPNKIFKFSFDILKDELVKPERRNFIYLSKLLLKFIVSIVADWLLMVYFL